MANLYDDLFNNAKGINIIKSTEWGRTVYWRYTILLDKKIDIKKFKASALNCFKQKNK